MGGLGNQMFQYAAGKAVARRCGTELMVDLSFLEQLNSEAYTKRNYELHVLKCTAGIADNKSIRNFEKWEEAGVNKTLSRVFPFLKSHKIFREPHFQYTSSIETLKDNTLLIGYWQSEKYFKTIANEIRNDFELSSTLEGENKKIAHQIQQSIAVSIHIRRGDYVTNAAAAKHHPVCSMEYYQKAISHIQSKISNPVFFIFSDDETWTRENIKIEDSHFFIHHNSGEKSCFDLKLMSLCKHNIIANSSFSWWGAWLNQYPDKICIRPSKWFNDPAIDTRDLCPDNWIAL